MKKNKDWVLNYWPTITLALLTTLLLFFLNHKPLPSNSSPTKFYRPHEYMKDFRLWMFDAAGKINYELQAAHWDYNQTSKQSTLEAPFLKQYQLDGSVWLIKSEQAVVQQTHRNLIHQVELKKSVLLEKPPTAAQSAIRITTDLLFYEPETHHAYTSLPVKLEKDSFQLTGHGLNAYLKKDTVELLHNVSSTYQAS